MITVMYLSFCLLIVWREVEESDKRMKNLKRIDTEKEAVE